jgi:hypothetical protein
MASGSTESAQRGLKFDVSPSSRLSNRRCWGTLEDEQIDHRLVGGRARFCRIARVRLGTSGLRIEKLQPAERYTLSFCKRERAGVGPDSGHDRKRLVRRRRDRAAALDDCCVIADLWRTARQARFGAKTREVQPRQTAKHGPCDAIRALGPRQKRGRRGNKNGEQEAGLGCRHSRDNKARSGRHLEDELRKAREGGRLGLPLLLRPRRPVRPLTERRGAPTGGRPPRRWTGPAPPPYKRRHGPDPVSQNARARERFRCSRWST